MKFEAVIWDMDGLLIDTERVSHESWKEATLEIQAEIDDDVFLEIIGMNVESFRNKLQELIGHQVDVPQLVGLANDIYHEKIKHGVPLKTGAEACIEWLAMNDIPQSVATSSNQKLAQRKLGHHGLLPKFHTIASGDQVSQGKPHPEIFLTAAQKMEVAPERCIAFEDSRLGVIAAAAAGAHVILVPDLAIHDDESRNLAHQTWESLEQGPSLFPDWFA